MKLPLLWQRLWQGRRPSLLSRAEALTAKGDWRRAAKCWRRLARDGWDERGGREAGAASGAAAVAVALTEYGRCCLHLERLAEARRALERALTLQPETLQPETLQPEARLARKLLGWVAAEQQNWPLAAEQWQRVINEGVEGAELVEAMQALASALIRVGAFEEAEGLLGRLAALDGGGERVRQLRALMAGLRLEGEGDSGGASAAAPPTRSTAGDALVSRTPPAPAACQERGSDYRPDDLRRAADAGAALRMLAGLGHLPRTSHIALMREAVEAFPGMKTGDEAALHSRYIRALVLDLGSATELRELQARARAYHRRFPDDWRARQLRIYAAVAADEPDRVAALLRPLAAQLGEHLDLDRLQVWLAAKRGDHAAAYRLAAQLSRKRYILAEDGRGLDLHPLNRTPKPGEWRQRHDRILLFACFRNERLFAPWFLDYYRNLGVERFFIVDNLSDDGTGDYLAKQDDVSAFASRDNFARAQSGMRWVNELIRRYGDDNWCIFVDADEELVLPLSSSFPRKRESRGKRAPSGCSLDSRLRGNDGSSSSPLRAFVDGMAARGEEVLPAFMVDTFPADLAALRDFGPGDAPGDLPNLMDTDYFISGNRFCPFLRVRGGARQRLFGSREHLEKAPILRGGMGPGETRRLYRSNHGINYARVSARRGVLLHHKLLREALEMLPDKANLQRTESRMRLDQWRHEHYRNSGYLSTAAEIPRGPATVPYESPTQLHRLGLLDEPMLPQTTATGMV